MRSLLPVFAAATAMTACGPSSPGSPTEAPPGEVAATLCAADVALYAGPTTDGAVAIDNLDAQIAGREDLVARRPHDLAARRTLVDLLLARTLFRGTYDDFDVALGHAEAALTSHPEEPAAHALLATVLIAVHRFDEALEALDEAAARGLDVEEARDTIRLARGQDLEDVLARREDAAQAHPSFTTLSGVAAALGALGRYDEADRTFQDALSAYSDVSPLPVAWVAFQRGVMWAEQADRPDLGCTLYGEGTARLPSYVVANVHLAELEQEASVAAATRRLEALIGQTGDPEPAGLLGEILLAQGEEEAAAPLIAQAKARYDELLARHRLAFADHGAEFFMGPGADPARALDLALDNLDNRPNDRAYQVAIEAALTADEPSLACAIAAETRDGASPVLADLVASLDCP